MLISYSLSSQNSQQILKISSTWKNARMYTFDHWLSHNFQRSPARMRARGDTVGWDTATNRNVVGSIPVGVTGVFHWHIPFSLPMAMELNQHLKEMSTANISLGVKAADAWGWQSYRLHLPIVLKSVNLALLEPPEAVQTSKGITSPLTPEPLQIVSGTPKMCWWSKLG